MPAHHPEDRPDPSEQPIRARVPEHVAAGAFSTGVIVMTAHTEFILDFVQNLGRPHQIIARVVMPHHVLPQLVDALQRNIELYRNRWGELPQTGQPRLHSFEEERGPSPAPGSTPVTPPPGSVNPIPGNTGAGDPGSAAAASEQSAPLQPAPAALGATGGGTASGGSGRAPASHSPGDSAGADAGHPPGSHGQAGHSGSAQGSSGHLSSTRQATVQDIYDDLKIRDEILSGAYANAVMIGHGPHEFSFDFITNFYPHSAVSARVFLAAGQIPRLFDSLKGTWEQLRVRIQPPPPPPPTRQPPDPSDEDNPFA